MYNRHKKYSYKVRISPNVKRVEKVFREVQATCSLKKEEAEFRKVSAPFSLKDRNRAEKTGGEALPPHFFVKQNLIWYYIPTEVLNIEIM